VRRIILNLLTLGALLAGALWFPAIAAGQQPDSLLATRIRADCVTAERDRSAPGYSKQAMARCKARADSIVALHKTIVAEDTVPPNQPPVASFSKSFDATTNMVAVNAGASTDDKGITSYAWQFGDGSVSNGVTATHIYAAAGTYTITATVRDQEGLSATVSQQQIVPDPIITPPPPPPPPPPDTAQSIAAPPELPQSTPNPAFGKATRVVYVKQASTINTILSAITFGLIEEHKSDFQAALNESAPGDSIVVTGEYVGNFTLPQRPCGAGITIVGTTKALTPGTRITPTTAAGFARLITPNTQPVLRTTNPTCGWRLAGLEITGTVTGSINYGIVWLGDGGWLGGGETQTTLASVPRDFVLSHIYLHGAPSLLAQRCLNLNSAHTVLRDSWISDCTIQGTQGQAVAVWNSPGPLLIENNFISGAGQNILIGGADPGIPGLIPSDITIRRNHIWKNPAWRGVYTVSFLLETKNVQRLLVEANVLENTWASAQSGMAIGFKSQSGCECGGNLWQGSTDITFRYNIVRNAQRGLNLQAVGEGGSDRHVARVVAEHNLFTGIGTSAGLAPTDGWLVLLTHGLKDVRISHNTLIGNTDGYGLAVYMDGGGYRADRLDLSDNVLAGRSYYALAATGGFNHAAALAAYATSYTFQRNAVAQVDAQFWGLNPSTSWYRAAVAELGLAADGSLAATSPFKGKGYGGADVGANVALLLQKTAGVVVAP
jgi:PKD repeat protein